MEVLERQLWLECSQGGAAAREQLVHQYMPLAKRLAAMLYARRAVNDVEFGDYLQLAYVGLLEAMQRYRYDAEVQFTTFATYRIRGSILNSIPKMTETGDRLSYLKRARGERMESWLEPSGAPPKQGVPALIDLVMGIAITVQLDEIAETEMAEPTTTNDPYASRVYDDTQRRVKDCLAKLPERERSVIDLHYFHHMAFDEIAQTFAVTRGRVSQLHKRALERIRTSLQDRQLVEFC
jgi:RNA polymerase sigma factor for flagellar operon FliA